MGKRDRKGKKSRNGGGGGGGGGGTMSSLRGGFRGMVGVGKKSTQKESLLSQILTYVLLAAAIALLIYRFTR